MLGSAEVAAYHAEEATKVLAPIQTFLENHSVRHRCMSVVGRALMGSVAQRVVTDSEIPVLLVK